VQPGEDLRKTRRGEQAGLDVQDLGNRGARMKEKESQTTIYERRSISKRVRGGGPVVIVSSKNFSRSFRTICRAESIVFNTGEYSRVDRPTPIPKEVIKGEGSCISRKHPPRKT